MRSKAHNVINRSQYSLFMGSGTTAAACEQLGANWIGMEGSVRWCDKIKERLQA
ncbi:MAG: site-specific DNA-methyltransferase [Desulfobacteraceae bacterium]|nr:site-specific DNA-methyltransferase [Desulfobacteraceae bacterium]